MPCQRSFLAATLLVVIAISGCGTGYQQIDGEWHYVTWDEGHGKREASLGADSDSFEILGDGRYAKDNARVWHQGTLVRDADPATFEVLAGKYCRDDQRVFYRWIEITGADPATFEILQAPYGRDQTTAYCGTLPMTVDDLAKFEVLEASEVAFTSITSEEAFERKYGDRVPDLKVSRAIIPISACRAQTATQQFEGPFEVRED